MSTRKRSGKKRQLNRKLGKFLWSLVTFPKKFFLSALNYVIQSDILKKTIHLSMPYEMWLKTLSMQTGQHQTMNPQLQNSPRGRKTGSSGTTKKRTSLDALHENLSQKTKILIIAKDLKDAAEKARELMITNDQWTYLRSKSNLRTYNPRYNIVCTTKNFNKSVKSQEIIREANRKGFTLL
jgi:hypothetical protein